MTLQELHERIGWQLEGRLQWRDHNGEWIDVSENNTPMRDGSASNFRRRPDQQPIPDEVFVSRSDNGRGLHFTLLPRFPDEVRYVRADAVIDGTWLQFRRRGGEWENCVSFEFRFKP